MAVSSLSYFSANLYFPSRSHSQSLYQPPAPAPGRSYETTSRNGGSSLVVPSAHSNPKLLKSNRKSRYGQTLSPYGSEEEEVEEDEEDEDYFGFDDGFFDDDFAETEDFEVNGKKIQSLKGINTRQGSKGQKENVIGVRWFDSRQSSKYAENGTTRNAYHTSNKSKEVGSSDLDGRGKPMTKKLKKNRYEKLSDEIGLDVRWLPLLDYLSTFGLKELHFVQMYERHMPSLQINVCAAQERLEYLLSVGVKQRDVKKILLRQPQVLEYTVENNLKAHVSFLIGLGIPETRIGRIISAAPSIFSYSVENSLKPTVRYLVEEVGINEKSLGKVIQLSPQILVQRIDISWNTRLIFLSKELEAPRDSVVKMVTKHPQLLHYSIDDGLLPRINFLRSIGMHNSDILKVLTGLTQVLSLSLEDNLKPKYRYLIDELHNEAKSLTKYPMYFSLSLEQRIRPRHRFLVSLKKAPKGPFPLGSLVPTDEHFCQQWAGTSLDKYEAFRQGLLLNEFARKYEKQ
ncbi:hypothetical protein HS088_TW19G00087 [Tripterygium wilfordii]|uniref:Mitochondrial transcription termination factor family protein n=1 Tax=Tripterygium wilfordii TaxID=458696 RepID=A0A7J7C9T4_TRIWF|nr:transcription termination factor MTERF9, chloroplastic [Tripterygium wilfordii]KAF5730496.1 hypothetical protein HS088_TW19G00087 [Tripterygium wilfordii]